MVGFGETFISAFALSFGFSERYSGIVTIIPLGIASIFQIFSTTIFAKFKNHKNIVVFCATMQALCLFSLVLQPQNVVGAKEGLILLLSTYWFFGLAAGPYWNTWIIEIFPNKFLPGFFARRGVVNQIVLILSLIIAGYFINTGEGDIKNFSTLFLVAGIARIFSMIALCLHPKDLTTKEEESQFDRKKFKDWINDKNVFGLLLFIGIFRLGVAIGAPYFTSYFLIKLKFTYFDYSLAIIAPFVSRALFFRYSEKILSIMGIQKVLLFSLSLVSILPILWTLNPTLSGFIFFQILSGIGWGGFEYAVLFRQIEDFGKEERSRVLLWTNLVIGVCSVIGVIFGSEYLGKNPTMDTYKELFTISTIVRFSPILLIFMIDWKSFRVVSKHHFMRIIGVRPNKGPEIRPILYKEESENEQPQP